MASPKLGVSATTSTSPTPHHPGSPSPAPEGLPSPVTPAPSPSPGPGQSLRPAPPTQPQPQARPALSIALILEELRVLQQRQIHQMQMTEEICKQVLQLGGATCGLPDSPQALSLPPQLSLPQLCLEGGSPSSLTPAPPTSSGAAVLPVSLPSLSLSSSSPLLACFPSLLPSLLPPSLSLSHSHSHTGGKPKPTTHALSHVLRPLKSPFSGNARPAQLPPSSSSNSSSSSSSSSPFSRPVPLDSLSLGLLPRYLQEKTSNSNSSTSTAHSNYTTAHSHNNTPFTFAFSPRPFPPASSLSLSLSLSHSHSHSPPAPAAPEEPRSGSSGGSGANPNAGTNGAAATRCSHACRFCGKRFGSDSALQIHLRSHTGERPYQCAVCLSRFTTRGNLKVHFLRHCEQNPELSLALLPPAPPLGPLGQQQQQQQQQQGAEQNQGQKRKRRRAEEGELPAEALKLDSSVGAYPALLSSRAAPSPSSSSSSSSGVPAAPPSSLPLPPSVDVALLSTAHSLLQLNRATAAASSSSSLHLSSSSSSTSLAPSLPLSSSTATTSSSSSSPPVFKGEGRVKRFDENTPPPPTSLQHPYSASLGPHSHLPKILFPSPTGSNTSTTSTTHQYPHSHHHLALLRPPHPHLGFPFPPLPRPPSSETSKLQRLVEKLEKDQDLQASSLPSETTGPQSSTTTAPSSSTTNTTLGLGNNTSSLGTVDQAATPAGLAPTQCPVCLRVLSCPRALRLHQASHAGERPFPCKLCGRSFSTPGSLRSHQATHRARPPARAQNSCPLCQRKFTNALVLQHHVRMHLGGHLPHPTAGQHGEQHEPTPSATPTLATITDSQLQLLSPADPSPVLDPSPDLLPPILDPTTDTIGGVGAPSTPPTGNSHPSLDLEPPLLESMCAVSVGGTSLPTPTSADPTADTSVGQEESSPGGSAVEQSLIRSGPSVSPNLHPAQEGVSLCGGTPPGPPTLFGPLGPALTLHSPEAGPDLIVAALVPVSPPLSSCVALIPDSPPPPTSLTTSLPSSTSPQPSPSSPSSKSKVSGSPTAIHDHNTSLPTACQTSPLTALNDISTSVPSHSIFTPPSVPHSAPRPDATPSLPQGDPTATPTTPPSPGSHPLPSLVTSDSVGVQGAEDREPPGVSRGRGPGSEKAGPTKSNPKHDGSQATPTAADAKPPSLPHRCAVCGRCFGSKNGLKGHMNSHSLARGGRRAAAQQPQPLPAVPPVAGGPMSFWNQYKAFLSSNLSPAEGEEEEEELVQAPANDSPASEDSCPTLAAEPPAQPLPQPEVPGMAIDSEEGGEEPGGVVAED
ncbi:sal-like protein 2 isoform X2 [Amia ocellicauda]